MNVTTAGQSHTTQKTNSTDGATGASSATPQRIDEFIEQLFSKANSEDFSIAKSSAETAARHGFTACGNLRYVEYLEAFRPTQLREVYAAAYPQCSFLPHEALRLLIKSLDLWCDLPKHYTGAIPAEQLPWLDIFELDPKHQAPASEMFELFAEEEERKSLRYAASELIYDTHSTRYYMLQKFEQTFKNSWFVVAPPAAFNSPMPFVERLRRLIEEVPPRVTIPPDDPLVIRFVKGGCLVVAAWGDEASQINRKVEEWKA